MRSARGRRAALVNQVYGDNRIERQVHPLVNRRRKAQQILAASPKCCSSMPSHQQLSSATETAWDAWSGVPSTTGEILVMVAPCTAPTCRPQESTPAAVSAATQTPKPAAIRRGPRFADRPMTSEPGQSSMPSRGQELDGAHGTDNSVVTSEPVPLACHLDNFWSLPCIRRSTTRSVWACTHDGGRTPEPGLRPTHPTNVERR